MSLGKVVFGSWETSDMTNPSRSTRNTTKWMPPHGSEEYTMCSRFLRFSLHPRCYDWLFYCNEFSDSVWTGKWLLAGISSRLTQRTHYFSDCFYFSSVQRVHLAEFLRSAAICYFNTIFVMICKMSNLRMISPPNYSKQTLHRKWICVLLLVL